MSRRTTNNCLGRTGLHGTDQMRFRLWYIEDNSRYRADCHERQQHYIQPVLFVPNFWQYSSSDPA
jgi:hypothetical protein